MEAHVVSLWWSGGQAALLYLVMLYVERSLTFKGHLIFVVSLGFVRRYNHGRVLLQIENFEETKCIFILPYPPQ